MHPNLHSRYTGLVAEAAAVLQDAGLWRYAATLAAGSLPPAAQAAVLDRWSTHALQVGGSKVRRSSGRYIAFASRP